MKKNAISLFVLILLCTSGFSQFRHSVGGGLLLGTGKVPAGAEEGSEAPSITGYGVHYFPRYNITESDNSAVSIGIPLIAGLQGSVNSRTGGNLSATLDLPLMVDYHFGLGAIEESESGFGGFAGLGFGYTYSTSTYDFVIPGTISYTEQLTGSSYGPVVHAGIKAYIADRTWGLRLFYKKGLEKAKFNVFGATLGIDL